MAAFSSLLWESKPAKLTSFIGEYLMQQMGWSILLRWTCRTHFHEWCLFTIYSSSKWQCGPDLYQSTCVSDHFQVNQYSTSLFLCFNIRISFLSLTFSFLSSLCWVGQKNTSIVPLRKSKNPIHHLMRTLVGDL